MSKSKPKTRRRMLKTAAVDAQGRAVGALRQGASLARDIPFPRVVVNILVATVRVLGVLVDTRRLAAEPSAEQNIIQRENAKEGLTDWQFTRVRLDNCDGCRASAIEGYCSKQSVAQRS